MRYCLLLLGVALLAGCSTPQKRAEERPEAFARLSKTDQKLVLNGQVREGLDTDAVYVALGRPSRKARGSENGVAYERWIYSRVISEPVRYRHLGTYYVGRHGPYHYCHYDTYWNSYVVDTFEVQFRNGIVTGWAEL
jgi:hypothetical protein